MRNKRIVAAWSVLLFFFPSVMAGQTITAKRDQTEFKQWDKLLTEYKLWLDRVGANGSRLWVRLDGTHRPYRLYVGDGFAAADFKTKEEFVDIFSRYLAGHPEKNMLIDLFDGVSGSPIGEFGWGGFRLYSNENGAKKEVVSTLPQDLP